MSSPYLPNGVFFLLLSSVIFGNLHLLARPQAEYLPGEQARNLRCYFLVAVNFNFLFILTEVIVRV